MNHARVTIRSAASICDNSITVPPIRQKPLGRLVLISEPRRISWIYNTLLHFNRSRRRAIPSDSVQVHCFSPRSPPLLGVSFISAPSCHLLLTRAFFTIKQQGRLPLELQFRGSFLSPHPKPFPSILSTVQHACSISPSSPPSGHFDPRCIVGQG